ncbi:MAG: hydrogenase expression/formation protein HypE, partial [Phycisphaerales bacterium]|nr:hydrogenase expression/formation protein HypE [Phycisphaerales bacterium]
MTATAPGFDATLLGTCPVPQSRYDRILLGHGSGGTLSNDLIRKLFV